MGLIEQAAKRLEELRRAGVEVPGATPAPATPDRTAAAPEHVPTPEAVVRALDLQAARAEAARAPATVAKVAAPQPDRHPAKEAGVAPSRIELKLAELRNGGFVTPDAPKSQTADEFRVIKRPIIDNARAGANRVPSGNLVMVTSALPKEGKTFTAVNLAMSIAMEVGTTVLLVDGDVAHPDLPRLLGIPESPGLLDVLTRDDVGVADALVRTNIDNLSILPAGKPHRRATELLASEQMAMLLRELAARYPDRIIIFDSPPLLATTEARVLATHMGQIIMVVAAETTRQHAVKLALGTIDGCENVLMMLNKAHKTDVGTYYGYYADDVAR